MINRVFKRFTALMLAAMLLFSLAPTFTLTVFAAKSGTVTGLSDGNIGLNFASTTGNAADDPWSASGTTITGSVVATSSMGCNTNYNSTLTITNNKLTAANLSFDYAVAVNSGTVQVDGTTVSSDGSYSYTKELAAGESIKVYLMSGSTTPTKITMTNIALVSDVTATTTFQPAENGSYTVDGNTVTETYSSTQSSTQGYAVAATPASGYQFMGWYDVTNEKYISTLQSTTLNMEYDATITARFAPVGVALFDVGGQVFEDLNAATAYATSNSITKVTLVSNGTLTGSYTIPDGVLLLIPFDDAKTLYTDTPVALYGGGGTRAAYKTLTLANGASLTINGGISVGGRYNSAAGSATGYMTGAYGLINMESDSRITVKSGGSLYAWGFVTGSGNVTVESGGTVYEWFQIADFRGGSATMNMGNEVFPFSQYFVQNVEVPLTLNAGATEIVYTGVYASSKVNNASITFIGDSGMFKVTSGSVTKTYDGATDRLRFTINGEMELNTLALNLGGIAVNSANYVLPITNNVSLEITSSSKLTVNQTAALLSGVDVTIDQGAELVVSSGHSVYLYDQDEWTADNYVTGGKFKSVTYAPGKTYTRTENDLVDAKIDVNGTFTVAGAVYTTAGGADICSSLGTGVYVQSGTPGTDTVTYQYTQGGANGTTMTSHDIAITAAKLHNADGSYTETANAAAGDTINYVNGVWGGEPAATEYTVTFDANGGEGSMDAQTVSASTDTALTANTFTRTGYTFTGWNTAQDGSGTPYANGATVNLTEDITLYAQWQVNTYTVTWIDEDGTELEKDENVPYGTTPEYNGETPTKEGDAQYSYTFDGWTPETSPVTSDVTYKAVYAQTVNQYTITWNNWDGTELLTEQVDYGQVPAYTGETPTREGDAEHTYSFSGWTPEIQAVTGNASYTAVFTDTINTYTVIWKNWDGTVLETDENVTYGTDPEYNSETPTKAGDAQYSYTFTGWSPAVDTVTGDITYTAVFEETVNQYTITWKNWDGTELKTEQVPYGTTPVYSGETPTREGNAQYSYTFTGWTPEITAVTGNAEYTAQFQENVNTYTVTWQNTDGTVLETDENVAYGTVPTYDGETPTKAADAQYTYAFKGWNPEITAVTGDVTYTAEYTATVNTYTVTWVDENDNVLETDTDVAYGTMPSYDGETPTKADDDSYSYTFSGWTPELNSVTGDVTYKATFTAALLVKHTVTFNANGGEGSMEPQVFIQGRDTKLTANTFTRENYKFTGWNTAEDGSGATYADEGSIINLTEDLTLYAQWQIWNGWYSDTVGTTYYVEGKQPYHSQWATIDGSTYYFNEQSYIVKGLYKTTSQDGTYEATFVFDSSTGVLLSDKSGLHDVGADTYWIQNGEVVEYAGLIRIVKDDGEVNYYYFAEDNEAVKNVPTSGSDYWVEKTNDLLPQWGYYFDENGVILHDADTTKNGIVEDNGVKYYYIDGIKVHMGLFKIDNDYYYAKSSGELIVNQSYYCSRMNDLLPEGTYAFDEEGKMIQPDTSKNGIVAENGSLYYYVDGKITYAGLIQIDGDYYYVRTSGEVVHGKSYWITKTNGLMDEGSYTFDDDGKMILPDTSKNGIVEENGSLYYYVDGELTYAGLIQIDGNYYYVRTSGEVVHGRSYWITKTNGLIDEGSYTFDGDGKMILPDTSKNGIVAENDSRYYYVDGVLTYAGLIKIDDSYYYVCTTGEVVHSRKYWITKTNGLMPEGSYVFDESGKMILPTK